MKKGLFLCVLGFLLLFSGCNDTDTPEELDVNDGDKTPIIEDETTIDEEDNHKNEQLIIENELTALLDDLESIAAFKGIVELEEIVDFSVTMADGRELVDNTVTTLLTINHITNEMESTIVSDNDVFTFQIFKLNEKLVSLAVTNEDIIIENVGNITIGDYIDERVSSVAIPEDPEIVSILKNDENSFTVEYNYEDFANDAFFEAIFGNDTSISNSSFETFTIDYTFYPENDSYSMEYSFVDLNFDSNLTLNMNFKMTFSILEEFTIIPLDLGDHNLPITKSVDDIIWVFEAGDYVKFGQTDGDNYIAFDLEPGYYAFFENEFSAMSNSYMIILDEDMNEILTDGYLYLEEPSRIYLNFQAFNGWASDDRNITAEEVLVVGIGDDFLDIEGEFTLTIADKAKLSYVVFPNVKSESFLEIELIDIEESNYLETMTSSRCTEIRLGNKCASKNYLGNTLVLSIQAFEEGMFTLRYEIKELDETSTDKSNPIPISELTTGMFTYDTIYVSFTITETGDYRITDEILRSGYYMNFTYTLYGASGNVIDDDWNQFMTLSPNDYIIGITSSGSTSVFTIELDRSE